MNYSVKEINRLALMLVGFIQVSVCLIAFLFNPPSFNLGWVILLSGVICMWLAFVDWA